ncbi:hypothetical protein PENSPDRAFT_670466 [Peniophora sp. CONT]|nr:hypothetical protein PENSPDRAFT_670466 [Peniophora sp. CONT]
MLVPSHILSAMALGASAIQIPNRTQISKLRSVFPSPPFSSSKGLKTQTIAASASDSSTMGLINTEDDWYLVNITLGGSVSIYDVTLIRMLTRSDYLRLLTLFERFATNIMGVARTLWFNDFTVGLWPAVLFQLARKTRFTDQEAAVAENLERERQKKLKALR